MQTATAPAAPSPAPYWLKDTLAPVTEELTSFDLEVEGTIPDELTGLYARNGANPREGHSGHWFLGDGMLHGVSLRGGKAEWYRNRWVRTPRFAGAPRTAESPFDIRNSLANTSVISHAGRILALVENALPMLMGRELETLGFEDYGGKLATSFTAHPKVCPATGEMHFFGYALRPPFLTYHVVDAGGVLRHSVEIPVKGATMVHDFALTRGHLIFMDLPVVFDPASAMRGTMPFAWSDSYGARLGILPRGAGIEALRWVEIEPCYVFHVANAFEEADGSIVIDVAWYAELWRGGPSDVSFEPARLKRWTIAPGATRASEQFLDDHAVEFPRVDDRVVGAAHRFVYAVDAGRVDGGGLVAGAFDILRKYDTRSGGYQEHVFHGGVPSEFVHVAARDGAAEDDGWLMGFVYDRARNASDFVILDAQNIAAKPVARVRLPGRVPQGFHGNWMPDAPA